MRIVIVEDEAPIREGLAKILHKINPDYELVGKAGDGKAGYELIRRMEPDLVILDIQMPKMDGLSMLRMLRKEQNHCRVLILSAYSDFNYAKQAIELDIENYLLKPIKIPELKRALGQIEEELDKEKSQDKVFTVQGIFIGCLNGQLAPDRQFHNMTMEKYGFSVENPAEVFVLWLGDGYEEQKKTAKDLLEDVGAHTVKFASCVIEADAWQMLIMILYRVPRNCALYEYFQNSVVPMLCSNLKSPVVCIWKSIERILDLPEAVSGIQKEKEWNLLLNKGTLLRKEEIEKLKIVPLKHPAELEDEACQAIKRGDWETLKECYRKLFQYYPESPHLPEEIKKSLIRFNWAVANSRGNIQELDAELEIQGILGEVSGAASWDQIKRSMEKFFELLDLNMQEKEELPVSVLVQKAQQMIRKYYDQGITLEEVANKLFVSEEYLSAQFKKETGATFSETIRKLRIEKVKQLLADTHLKLNQIAELAGYSDPKYMSKVFKEEVGMLPNEFRKSVH